MPTDEENRAREYRDQQARRAQATAANQQRLAGNQAARAALEAKWRPVVLARLERDQDDGHC